MKPGPASARLNSCRNLEELEPQRRSLRLRQLCPPQSMAKEVHQVVRQSMQLQAKALAR